MGDVTPNKPLAVACKAYATSVLGGESVAPDAALVSRVECAARVVATELSLVEADDLEVVASAIHLLASTRRPGDVASRLAQFPSSLRTLLELHEGCKGISEEAGRFLAELETAVSTSVRCFHAEAPDRERQRHALRVEAERVQAEALRHAIEASEAPSVSAGLEPAVEDGEKSVTGESSWHGQDIPAHWKRSPEYPNEWMDTRSAGRTVGVLSKFKLGYVHYVVSRERERVFYEGIVRWSSGATAVTIRSPRCLTAGLALQECLKIVATCPDERSQNWQLRMSQECIKGRRPSRIAMRNTVPVGVPQYICTAIWDSTREGEEKIVRSSLQCQSQNAAFMSLLARVNDTIRQMEPRKVASAGYEDRLRSLGLTKPQMVFSKTAPYVCSIIWNRLDGKRIEVKNDGGGDNKEDAFEAALELVKKELADPHLNWQVAAQNRLGNGGQLSGLSTSFHEETGTDGQGRFQVCTITWSGRAVRGKQGVTRAEAFASACQMVADALATRKQVAAAAVSAKDAAALLRKLEPRWTAERSRLMQLKERSQAEQGRVRDLSTYLALCDPLRRGSVDEGTAMRLIAALPREADAEVNAGVRHIDASQHWRYLRLMVGDGFKAAGTAAVITDGLREHAKGCGRTPEDIVQELVAARALSRRRFDLGLSMIGAALVNKSPNLNPGAHLPEKAAGVLLSMR